METAPVIPMGKLHEFLLNTALVVPVFIWGPPGVGKSALVEQFAARLGLPCVSLLGTQLAPEDLIGVPRIESYDRGDGSLEYFSVFAPPRAIARTEPYVLFLDELNGSGPDVQKAFYSLIHERRLGEYRLPEGSVIVAAGNRASDNAIVRPMSSALINRMAHVSVRVDHDAWLEWAISADIHPMVYEYVRQHPRHLHSKPPKEERAFSSPRAWHQLSNMLKSWEADLDNEMARVLAETVLTPEHAKVFAVWYKNRDDLYRLNHMLKGEESWPVEPEASDLRHYLALQFRDQLIKELPEEPSDSKKVGELASRALVLLRSLADLSPELAQMVVVADSEGRTLPDWFMIEIGDELPSIVARHKPQTSKR